MKKIRFYRVCAALSAAAVVAAGCTQDIMDDINKREYNPTDAAAKYIVPELLTATAFSTVGGDFSLYASIYIEHEAGVHGQMYNAEIRQTEPTSSTTYNNVWEGVYTNIKLAKLIISKCSTEGSVDYGNQVTLGIAQVMLAYNAAVLTDLFGDVPFFQAGEMNPDATPKYKQPVVDKQEDIYKEVFALLDKAIDNFGRNDGGVAGAVGAKDIYYGTLNAANQKAKWTKAAYGLKARYTMRLGTKSPDGTNYLAKVVEYADSSFASSAEELKFALYDGDAQNNPFYGFSASRDGFGASKSLLDKFVDNNDPRADQFFYDWNEEAVLSADDVFPAPNGETQQQQFYYSLMAADYASTAPTQLLSYYEVQFLKAEALARNGNTNEAKDALRNAVLAALNSQQQQVESAAAVYEVDFEPDFGTTAVATAYFDGGVTTRFNSSPVKEVVLQKYLAFAGATGESLEAYSDYRRVQYLDSQDGTSYSVELKNAKNATMFPQRFTYGNSDVISNPNVKAIFTNEGRYVYTEKVWWAGGTR